MSSLKGCLFWVLKRTKIYAGHSFAVSVGLGTSSREERLRRHGSRRHECDGRAGADCCQALALAKHTPPAHEEVNAGRQDSPGGSAIVDNWVNPVQALIGERIFGGA